MKKGHELSKIVKVGNEHRAYCLKCNRPSLMRDEKDVMLMGDVKRCHCDPENKDEAWRLRWIEEKIVLEGRE